MSRKENNSLFSADPLEPSLLELQQLVPMDDDYSALLSQVDAVVDTRGGRAGARRCGVYVADSAAATLFFRTLVVSVATSTVSIAMLFLWAVTPQMQPDGRVAYTKSATSVIACYAAAAVVFTLLSPGALYFAVARRNLFALQLFLGVQVSVTVLPLFSIIIFFSFLSSGASVGGVANLIASPLVVGGGVVTMYFGVRLYQRRLLVTDAASSASVLGDEFARAGVHHPIFGDDDGAAANPFAAPSLLSPRATEAYAAPDVDAAAAIDTSPAAHPSDHAPDFLAGMPGIGNVGGDNANAGDEEEYADVL